MAAFDESSRLRRERDLYRRLLDLGQVDAIEPLLREALDLIVAATAARHGYLELYQDADAEAPQSWMAHGLTDAEVAEVRSAISRGIIAETIASGGTVATASALLDSRFRGRQSVQLGQIEAVLCTPVGEDPPRGVVYLQRSAAAGPFSDDDHACAEIFARHLVPLVDRLLALRHTRDATDRVAPLRARLRLENVVGRSAALAAVLEQVALVAPLDVTVLLTGDSGTGKTQLARVIHDNGPRASGPFVSLNCAALPETLLESELFGALPGAHSTATRRVEGKVAAAEGGTLLLDEVGELAFGAQAKLLHLIQSKEYYPLGATRPVHADVRVMAATNAELGRLVAERKFRGDLLYRLQVMPIRVPTLAERCEDVPLLATEFCRAACVRHQLPALVLSRDALRAVASAEWPGNVRQLQHTVEGAVIRAAGTQAQQVERGHLFPDPTGASRRRAPTLQDATRRFQADLIRDALERNGWNVLETARQLDVARSHLYTLIRAFGLARDRR